jgi:hypothetical protein
MAEVQDYTVFPIGISNFARIRENKSIYVDKTMYLPMLMNAGIFLFCARPRRFGKSLLISSLEAFYSGKTDLFKGLAVEEYMCSPDFVSYPVVRLDMSSLGYWESKDELIHSIMVKLVKIAKCFNISLVDSNFAQVFQSLLHDIHQAYGLQPVLLIDEYDSPVITVTAEENQKFNSELLLDTRDVMERFYLQIKVAEDDIFRAFITGITKYSRMGVFSQLNNLLDISLESRFSALMGYTQKELEDYFAPYINSTALKLQISEESLLEKIRDYYNGFSFDGDVKLYNPFSILNFFWAEKFRNFWMLSGSNRFIRKFLKDKAVTADEFQGKEVDSDFASAPGDIDATEPHGFLYQAGYLTLRTGGKLAYTLSYPNLEVRESISKLFLNNIISKSLGINSVAKELSVCLASCDIPGMVPIFYQLFAGICHKDHRDANRSPVVRVIKKLIRKITGSESVDETLQNESADLVETLEKAKGESFYRSLLLACLWMAGAKVTPEKPENIGDLDLEVYYGGLTYVFELKMAKNARGATVAARNGMRQIHERGYGLASKDPVFVSLAFGKAEKNIVGCIFEKDGQETTEEVKSNTRRGEVAKKGDD